MKSLILSFSCQSQETIHINLKNPVPIYILYFTNVIKNSELYFLEDIYEYDKIIAQNLVKKIKQIFLKSEHIYD